MKPRQRKSGSGVPPLASDTNKRRDAASTLNNTPKDTPSHNGAKEGTCPVVPQSYNERIRQTTSNADIKKLAAEIGVFLGLVAGRYQFLTQVWHRFKSLIRTFDWKPQSA